ncbi:hypothetical protein BDV33DRAFT_196477 [Aspergillus novoparasiticus]|uniref:D-isomer specific 2-hydroxyacid dehydrogenase NAD-binding domain-containing protein n=1 Tax=Aspergillus novoparasiticus TaxID=986946 RepID=A0A5N6E8S8_9EURO|nr:hypothetical protein BDV33DRAFT_196477 [Aspergillus novoparasiticus]
MQNLVKHPKVLLIIAPWGLQVSFLKSLQTISPGIRVITSKYISLFEDSNVVAWVLSGRKLTMRSLRIAEWVIATFFLGFQHHYNCFVDFSAFNEDMEDAVGLRMCVYHSSVGMKDKCARLANAPGMDIHAFTLHERPTPECKRDHSYVEAGMGDPNGDIPPRWCHGCDQLNEFLAGLDLLVITLPLTSLTRGMIAREQFQTLGKRNAFVGNVVRGPIVNTDDLVDALNNGTIRGAAVDVTGPEPLATGHPLWKAKNF